MYPGKIEDYRESIVIPLFETVVYPKSRTKLLANKITGELLLNKMKDAEFTYAVGLTVKSGVKASELTKDNLYKTGNLLKISFVQPSDNGYLIAARALYRVEVESLYQLNEYKLLCHHWNISPYIHNPF
jgi:ATP-dependent Lon protease